MKENTETRPRNPIVEQLISLLFMMALGFILVAFFSDRAAVKDIYEQYRESLFFKAYLAAMLFIPALGLGWILAALLRKGAARLKPGAWGGSILGLGGMLWVWYDEMWLASPSTPVEIIGWLFSAVGVIAAIAFPIEYWKKRDTDPAGIR